MNKVYMLMEGTEYHTPRARSVHSTLESATKRLHEIRQIEPTYWADKMDEQGYLWCYRRYSFMMIEEIELDP
jgi:hypothetical protein